MKEKDLSPKDPHDRLFKRVMSDEANVRQFIKEFLPKELSSQIDLKEMKLIPLRWTPMSRQKLRLFKMDC